MRVILSVAMVDGSIPRGAGLSSSSALVVAAALATATANGMKVRHTALLYLCCAAC